MNLMSNVNIKEDRKECKTVNALEKAAAKKDFGYSIYESLEYVKNNLGQNSLRLQMEMMKSFVR